MKSLRAGLILCAALLLAACSRAQVWQHEAFVFGTRAEVSVWAKDAEQATGAMGAVLREFDRMHRA